MRRVSRRGRRRVVSYGALSFDLDTVMRTVLACLSVSFALAFSAEAAVQVTGSAQGVTLPGACSVASPGVRFTPSTGAYTFTCTQDNRSYACTQSGAAATSYSTGTP